MLKIFFPASMIFTAAAVAQPEKIIIHSDGTVELIQHKPAGEGDDSNPFVPVFTEQDDSSLVPGAFYSGINHTGQHSLEYPGAVAKSSDGSWIIKPFTWSVNMRPSKQLYQLKIPGSELATILNASTITNPSRNGRRGGPTFLWSYDHSGAPGGLLKPDIESSIARAIEHYKELFKDDPALWSSFKIKWGNLGPDDIAVAHTTQQAELFRDVRQRITTQYGNDSRDTDSYESTMYNGNIFPLGNSIKYAHNSDSTDSTDLIIISLSLHTKFFGTAFQDEILEIEINADRHATTSFDPDPSDGINGIDLTGVLVHEFGHHFGFKSAADTVNPTRITVWDIFRFNANLGFISLNNFSSGTRELRSDMEANAALQLNSTKWAKGLSRGQITGGDGQFAEHWKDNSFTGVTIGIMDPTASVGSLAVNGSYFQPSDIRAFDILGYSIHSSDFDPPPDPVTNTPVKDAAIDPTLPLDLAWTPGAGTSSSDILIYDLGTTINIVPRQGTNQPPVFRADNITGSTLTVTTAQLQLLPGHRYQWHAAVYNPMGVALTDPATFIAQCAAERTGDLSIDFFDISDFLADFGAMDPSADLNNDGLWNFFDVSTYLQIFADGCP